MSRVPLSAPRYSRVAIALVGIVSMAAGAAARQSELVIYNEGTKLYHRPGCPAIRDVASVLALTRAQAEGRGYKPHADCDPANPHAKAVPPNAPAPPPPTVYVDGPKYYHRKSCVKLAADSPSVKPLSLDAAAKSHWPCPVCKPPIYKRTLEPAVPGTTNRRRGG